MWNVSPLIAINGSPSERQELLQFVKQNPEKNFGVCLPAILTRLQSDNLPHHLEIVHSFVNLRAVKSSPELGEQRWKTFPPSIIAYGRIDYSRMIALELLEIIENADTYRTDNNAFLAQVPAFALKTLTFMPKSSDVKNIITRAFRAALKVRDNGIRQNLCKIVAEEKRRLRKEGLTF